MSKKILLTGTAPHIYHFHLEHIKKYIENGYEIDVACSDINNKLNDIKKILIKEYKLNVNVYVVDVPRSPFNFFQIRKGARQLKRIINSNSYDCIITNEPVMGVATRLANRKRCLNDSTKLIYIAHGFHFYKGGNPIKNTIFLAIEKLMGRYTDALITINSEDYEASKRIKLHLDSKKYYKINGIGVKLDRFYSITDSELRNKLRYENLGLGLEEIGIIYTAELNENKNHRVIIQGLRILLDENYKIKVFFLGDGKLKGELKSLVSSYSLDNNVSFLGYVYNVQDYLPLCDIGVSASIREGLGLNIVEDMACGLPCVASDNRGHRDLVVNDKGGYIFETNNPASFVDCIKKIINGDFYDSFGEYNLQIVDDYSVESVNGKLLKIISTVLEEQ